MSSTGRTPTCRWPGGRGGLGTRALPGVQRPASLSQIVGPGQERVTGAWNGFHAIVWASGSAPLVAMEASTRVDLPVLPVLAASVATSGTAQLRSVNWSTLRRYHLEHSATVNCVPYRLRERGSDPGLCFTLVSGRNSR